MCAGSNLSNSNFVRVIYMIALSALSLAPNNEMKEALTHMRFNIIHHYQECAKYDNSADPDETPHCVASHLGLRYL